MLPNIDVHTLDRVRSTLGSAAPSVYRVWAPRARHIALHLDDRLHEMTAEPGGWWTAPQQPVHGARYGYVVDGEGPFPDPRSPSQPSGVHGLSCHIDHSRFIWTDQRWQAPPLAAAAIYELHAGTFTDEGTFDSAISRLPNLVDLGVTCIELMPIAEFPGGRGWGYDGVDLFAPHHAYGTPDDLKRLVDACHASGLAVILDVVFNHLGPSGNYLARFGPYFTSRHATPWGDAVNLDGSGSDEVRRFFCDNALMWLRDYHFDGLRIDAVHALVDSSACHFLEQLAREVATLEATTGRHCVLIAESDLNDPRLVRSREAGGYGLDAQWSDDFHHALHALITGERSGYYADFSGADLATALNRVFVYAGRHSGHRQRSHGRPAHDLPGWRFVVAAQTHDQIGNRACGERLTHLTSPGRAKIAAALVLCAPFVPMLFQGEEWGASTPFLYFTAHDDPELGRRISEGRRREFANFGWDPAAVPDPQSAEAFERSRLRWSERMEPPHAEMLEWHRALIALRREQPSLRDGDYPSVQVRYSEAGQQLVVTRGRVWVVCNLANCAASIEVPEAVSMVLASDAAATRLDNGVLLPPESVAILVAPHFPYTLSSA
jgi:maltooligosyltrehalose trehalohydrolase